MKTQLIILHAAVLMPHFFGLCSAGAQGTTYVSTLGQPPDSSLAVGSDSWIAQSFVTGTNTGGYLLNSVQLRMDVVSGMPAGLNVFLYTGLFSASPTNLGRLSGPDSPSAGTFTYSADGITLMPSGGYGEHTDYYIVLSAATPIAQGAFSWSTSGDAGGDGPERWFIPAGYFFSNDGLSWNLNRSYTMQIAVNASAIPEPPILPLILLGSGFLVGAHRRKKHLCS
jgi:hypothetical protein